MNKFLSLGTLTIQLELEQRKPEPEKSEIKRLEFQINNLKNDLIKLLEKKQ